MLIDISGSMNEKLEEAKRNVLQTLAPFDAVSVSAFTAKFHAISPLRRTRSSESKAELRKTIQSIFIPSESQTDICTGITSFLSHVQQSLPARGAGCVTLLVVTDGMHSHTKDEFSEAHHASMSHAYGTLSSMAAAQGRRIVTVVVELHGGDVNRSNLNTLMRILRADKAFIPRNQHDAWGVPFHNILTTLDKMMAATKAARDRWSELKESAVGREALQQLEDLEEIQRISQEVQVETVSLVQRVRLRLESLPAIIDSETSPNHTETASSISFEAVQTAMTELGTARKTQAETLETIQNKARQSRAHESGNLAESFGQWLSSTEPVGDQEVSEHSAILAEYKELQHEVEGIAQSVGSLPARHQKEQFDLDQQMSETRRVQNKAAVLLDQVPAVRPPHRAELEIGGGSHMEPNVLVDADDNSAPSIPIDQLSLLTIAEPEGAGQNPTEMADAPGPTCPVCFNSDPDLAFVEVSCIKHHRFCTNCVNEQIQVCVSSNMRVMCLSHDECKHELTEQEVHKHVQSEDLFLRYLDRERSREAATLKDVEWCPRGCGSAICYPDPAQEHRYVCELCKLGFCKLCKELYHYNSTCSQAKEYKLLARTTMRLQSFCGRSLTVT